MSSLFDTEGPLMTALMKLSNLVVLNVLFVICCVPLITIGASIRALTATAKMVMEDREGTYLFKDFFKAFQTDFLRSTLLWLITAVVCCVMWMSYHYSQLLIPALSRIYAVLLLAITLLLVCVWMYVYPLLVKNGTGVIDTLRDSCTYAVLCLPWTLAALAVTAVPWVLSFLMNSNYGAAVFLWLVCLFGVVAYLNSFVFQRAFLHLDPEARKAHQEQQALLKAEQEQIKKDNTRRGAEERRRREAEQEAKDKEAYYKKHPKR